MQTAAWLLVAALCALLFWWPVLCSPLLLLLVVRAVLFLAPGKAQAGPPRKGAGEALVVLGLQQVLCEDERQHPGGYALIARANEQIAVARQLGDDVFYPRLEFKRWDPLGYLLFGGRLTQGFEGAALAADLDQSGGAQFAVNRPDAFSSGDFAATLDERGIERLTILGLNAASNVLRTARSARKRCFKVTIVSDTVLYKSEEQKRRALRTAHREGIEVK